MVTYLDWAQTVLRAVLRERPPNEPLSVHQLANELGLSQSQEVILALDHVLRDLRPWGLVKYDSGNPTFDFPPAARRFRTEPLSSAWHEMRSGYLSPEDEEFLVALARVSERQMDNFADTAMVLSEEVVDGLGRPPDRDKGWAICGHLVDRHFAESRAYAGPTVHIRVTYAGLVRATDETGAVLREAEDRLQMHRLRAAGCVAGVELERRLKRLLGGPPQVSARRDPTLQDYNKAAFEAGLIDQETWTLITNLAAIRKRCAHVLDRDPERDEVRELVDGVERVLRKYP